MDGLRYLTAGESHGKALVGILEGMPAHVPLLVADIDRDLARRQLGHGRSARMKLEQDRARILGGVRHGETIGSPIALVVENLDAVNWAADMAVEPGFVAERPIIVPRPGHADLAGGLKYGWSTDLRGVAERASARETAMRVAVGAVARRLLAEVGIEIASHVVAIGEVTATDLPDPEDTAAVIALRARADVSPVRCPDALASAAMVAAIDAARADRDSLGGLVEVVAAGLPVGLGSHVHWDRKLDGRLAGALMSVQAVKGVEVGAGFAGSRRRGSAVHDPIHRRASGWGHDSNFAGGIEGGISTGEPLRLRVAKKPISTLMRPLPSANLITGEPASAHVERADTCAVPALGVACEAVVALVLAGALLEMVGGDTLDQVRRRTEEARGAAR